MSSSAFCLYNILRNITKVCCSCGLGPLGTRPMTTSNVCYATHGGSPNEAPPKFRHVSNGGPPNSPSNEARPNSPPNGRQLTLASHIHSLCRACYYQLRQLRTVSLSLTSTAAATLV